MSVTEANPLAEGLRLRRRPDPCAIVIFGASGDLTRRKLFPALYALAYRRLLPERFGVIGVARTEQTHARSSSPTMKKAVKEFARDPFESDVWNQLAEGIRYVATDFASDAGEDLVLQTPQRAGRRGRDRPEPRLLPGRAAAGLRDGGGGDRRAPQRRGVGAR